MGIPDHLTCLLRSMCAGQEAIVRTGHGTLDWLQTGKGICQGYILSPCLINLYAKYIMWNSRLDKSKAGIKVSGRSINNPRYTDDTTLTSESEEELNSLLMKVKEESGKSCLKIQHSKNKVDSIQSHNLMSNMRGNNENKWQISFSLAPKSLWTVTATMQLKSICSLKDKLWWT